jgi:hypothetical protein
MHEGAETAAAGSVLFRTFVDDDLDGWRCPTAFGVRGSP